MSNTPDELYYLASHQWLRMEDDGTATVGITDFAQEELGDVVYVELPEVGSHVTATSEVSVIESVKTASDVFSPVTGEVLAVNEVLADTPELINSSPYEAGWIYKIQPENLVELDDLLSADAYASGCD